jgi:uncharacterized protein (TIGR02466 family)
MPSGAPAVPVHTYFPTRIYSADLGTRDRLALNRRLLRECLQMPEDDAAGRKWSASRYPGGYTSYASASRMHEISPTFARLRTLIDRHVRRYAKALAFDLDGRKLAMSDCWVNLMPRHVVHGRHLHPLSAVSGTYYVQTPKGVPGLKFEDPRLDRFMASPPRRPGPGTETWVVMPARAGGLLLFESWLRHEVLPNPVDALRVSISFNYGWL